MTGTRATRRPGGTKPVYTQRLVLFERPDMVLRLEERAHDLGMSVAALVRYAIRQHVLPDAEE